MESCQNLQANSKFDNPCDQTLSWKPLLSLNCGGLYRNVAVFWWVTCVGPRRQVVKPTLRNPVNQPTNCWLYHSPLIGLETNMIRVLLYIYYIDICHAINLQDFWYAHETWSSSTAGFISIMPRPSDNTTGHDSNLCVEKRWDAPRETWIMDWTFAKWARKRREQYLQDGKFRKNMWKRKEREMKGNQGFL